MRGGGNILLLKNKNLYSIYSALYEGADLTAFNNLCNKVFLRGKCGEKYVRTISTSSNPLSLKQDAISTAAQQAASVFFGNEWQYGIILSQLCDNDSRRLFALEILQKTLLMASFTDEEATTAICTGITQSRWARLMEQARTLDCLSDCVGRVDYSDEENDDIINFSKVETFILDQYEYKDICTLQKGDTFLDCGACYGDTAIWAMEKVGDSGTVVSFEPIETQLATLQENISRYSAHSKAKTLVVNAAVCNDNGHTYFSDYDTSANNIYGGTIRVNTIRIDDYCRANAILPNYIKMDIEGAELSALFGAQDTITQHKPRLAICMYHKPREDFLQIPIFLKSCVPEYKFYLKKSGWVHSTVLFAVP